MVAGAIYAQSIQRIYSAQLRRRCERAKHWHYRIGHNFRPLPESMYHREGDTILVYPTDQNLQLLLYTTNDNARYHAGIPVNRRFDFEVISKTGTTSTDALNALGNACLSTVFVSTTSIAAVQGWAEGAHAGAIPLIARCHRLYYGAGGYCQRQR